MERRSHPKNVIKYCLRCGCDHFITSDEGRSFKCEECGFTYFINNSAAVACLIFDDDNKLLLCRRAVEPEVGKLDLPGGFVEPMETAEQAVKREIMEELKVNIISQEYLTSFPNEYLYSGFSVFTLDMAFLCKIDSIKNIVPGDDISAVEFVSLREIQMKELCSDSMRNIINYYIAKTTK